MREDKGIPFSNDKKYFNDELIATAYKYKYTFHQRYKCGEHVSVKMTIVWHTYNTILYYETSSTYQFYLQLL